MLSTFIILWMSPAPDEKCFEQFQCLPNSWGSVVYLGSVFLLKYIKIQAAHIQSGVEQRHKRHTREHGGVETSIWLKNLKSALRPSVAMEGALLLVFSECW